MIPATELDFDNLKRQIVDYIKTDQTFTDYSFEGSALNAVIDLLAYNTHTNAFYGSMIHNESFLDTAQKRSSVVSRAKEMGYVPRSAVCSTAMIDLTLSRPVSTNTLPLVIERGSSIEFTSTNSTGSSFTFVTPEDVTASRVVSSTMETYSFPGLKIVAGKPVKQSIVVSPSNNQTDTFIITIPNKNVDISTLKVSVRQSNTSLVGDIWNFADTSNVITPTDLVYYIQESYDGYFQIYFGEDIVGKKAVNGNAVDLFYIVSSGDSSADGCRYFTMSGITTGSFSDLQASIVTRQVSFGGSDKEPLKSIRYNAVLANSAKNRSVSTSDYELVLRNKFNYIKSVSVWGGEDNYPPVYGKVFVSVQPVSGLTISDTMKNVDILPELRKFNLVTVRPEIVDPAYTFIEFITLLRFNSKKSVLSNSAAAALIKTTILNYIGDISTYNINYVESDLISKLANADSGFSSVQIDKRIGFNVAPIQNILTTFHHNVNNVVIPSSISSTKFIELNNGIEHVVSIKEIPNSSINVLQNNGETHRVIRVGTYNQLGALVSDVGSVNTTLGVFSLSFSVYKYMSSSRFVAIRMNSVDRDISVKRNQIITMDMNSVDSQIGLMDNNVVNIELTNA